MPSPRSRSCRPRTALLAAAALAALPGAAAHAQNVSAPAILQMFEASYKTLERRAPDMFMAGFGGLWTPPPGRAEQGNQSVGYDVYDRFDLGSGGKPTLYGTETGLKTVVNEVHKFGASIYTDMVWNHNGLADLATPGFKDSGGYPGFVLTRDDDVDGDFHGAFEGGDFKGRIPGIGLIDIAPGKKYDYIRNPVPGFANNLPAGTTPAYERLANVPTEANRRFYTDLQGPTYTVDGITYHRFNTANPSAGDPVAENSTGYLMRHARWMIETIGIDGFRLDATKHMIQEWDDVQNKPHDNPDWVLEFLDQAVHGANQRLLLDGTRRRVFSFGEFLDGNVAKVQQSIKKDGFANRDALDFALHYALERNLKANGLGNDWRLVVEDTQDRGDGLANDGSQGVAFDASHDEFGAELGNVANAYLLMRPGNAVVYFNAREFDKARNFPKASRGDVLGGLDFGDLDANGNPKVSDKITKLVNIRNTHGRGNYAERWIDKETLVFEREKSMVVGLSNRGDGGFDTRWFDTAFEPGQRLVELTGNATDPKVDPTGNDIHDWVLVQGDRRVGINIPRNANPSGEAHGRGYVVYGLPGPKGTISLTGVAKTLAGQTPTSVNDNGIVRQTAVEVIRGDSFNVTLQTNPVLVGGWHDVHADGDSGMLRIDGGVDVNNNGQVDITAPGDVSYGFENFQSASPLYGGGTGAFSQTVNAANLSEGYHYVTARAYRHRNSATGGDGGPAVYTDFKKVVYVDRQRPVSAVDRFVAISGSSSSRDLIVKSLDKTATGVAVFHNIGANQFTIDQLVQLAAGGSNSAREYDRDEFAYGIDYTNGNHSTTIVTFELTYDGQLKYAGGGVSVQRINAIAISNGRGKGLGDLTFDNAYSPNDVDAFETVLASNNTSFNPAADLNADGLVDESDNVLNVPWLTAKGASAATIAQATSLRLKRAQALNGTLHVPAGALSVSGASVAGVPLTFSNNFALQSGKTLTKTGAETLNINGSQFHQSGVTLVTAGGATHINSDGGTSLAVSTTGAGSATNFTASQRIRGLSVAAGGAAKLTTDTAPGVNGGKVIVTRSLAADTGKLDLTNNNLAVDYTGASVLGAFVAGSGYDGVTGMLARGYNAGGWNGATGVVSSSAAGNSGKTTLAVGEASAVLGLTGTQTATWFGRQVDATSVLVKYTRAGDADLNGKIDGDDYFRIDSSIGAGGVAASYFNGDFDYNGKVNGDDYFIIDSNASLNGGAALDTAVPAAGGVALADGATTAVPEPAGLVALAIAAAACSGRRRRRPYLSPSHELNACKPQR
ncbi:MAG TPA: alpha-amylase family glycosyl hydrolase [Tepidisphaeraceae bacterium]|nr:alpha-amylase family glycosyl hydrolase [Tepidisphaeraceae bacterium]